MGFGLTIAGLRAVAAVVGLTTGVLHALVAMDMPGPGTVFHSFTEAVNAMFVAGINGPVEVVVVGGGFGGQLAAARRSWQ